ncbi:MAG: PIN domain-containing protein [Candidatus Aenigmarchaeota archaeon]|nr:PIN domain-containing protein [Candidatus Aenigmarchaeota archaeon]
MIFIDTWLWLEFFLEGKKFKKVRKLLEKIKNGKEKGMITPLVLAEIKFNIEKKVGIEDAEEVIFSIENFPNLRIASVTPETAKLGANLRSKYYEKPRKALSYADTINLATAIIERCETLYTGDEEFEGIEEIKIKII